MKILIEIEISEEDWREAIAEGWNEMFGEKYSPEQITTLDNPEDAQRALPNIKGRQIKCVTVRK